MHYLDNNALNTDKVLRLLCSIFSENIHEQCCETEYPEKIEELKILRESIICLPFHQEIPPEIMGWVKRYFADDILNEHFYDFRHHTQRTFMMSIDETIRTLEYDLDTEEKIKRVDISNILEKIMHE